MRKVGSIGDKVFTVQIGSKRERISSSINNLLESIAKLIKSDLENHKIKIKFSIDANLLRSGNRKNFTSALSKYLRAILSKDAGKKLEGSNEFPKNASRVNFQNRIVYLGDDKAPTPDTIEIAFHLLKDGKITVQYIYITITKKTREKDVFEELTIRSPNP